MLGKLPLIIQGLIKCTNPHTTTRLALRVDPDNIFGLPTSRLTKSHCRSALVVTQVIHLVYIIFDYVVSVLFLLSSSILPTLAIEASRGLVLNTETL